MTCLIWLIDPVVRERSVPEDYRLGQGWGHSHCSLVSSRRFTYFHVESRNVFLPPEFQLMNQTEPE